MSKVKEDVSVNETQKAGEILGDLSQVNALSDMFPELAEDDEFKGLAETVKKVTSTPAPKRNEEEEIEEEEEEDDEVGDGSVDSEENNEEEEDDDEEEEEEEVDENDVFGTKKQSKKVEVPFSLDEKGKEFLKKRYSIGDESKFFTSVDKWRNDSQKLSEVEEQNAELLEGLAALPDNIKASINAYVSGQDYNEAFGNVDRLNFNKEFDDQDKDNIVKHYFPDKYKSIIKKLDEDEIEETDADERISDLADAAKALYKKDKKAIEDKRADLIRIEQEKTKKIKESVTGSVKNLEKSHPNFKVSEKQRIRQLLIDGNPESIFFNKDGSYREDAALMMAHALHYDKLTKKVESAAKNRGVTEANLDIVNKGKKKLDKGKAAVEVKNKELSSKAIEHLTPHFAKDPYE